MDVREKLVKLLNEVQETGVNEIPAGFGCTREYIANENVASHLTAHGVTVQEWIPVTERFPEIGHKCLIANREIVVRGWLRPDGVWKTGVSSDEIWSNFSLYPPTHWMPLPEPPKGE